MKKKNLNHSPSLLLTLAVMMISALLIYKVFPKPGEGIAACNQETSGKCSHPTECTRNK